MKMQPFTKIDGMAHAGCNSSHPWIHSIDCKLSDSSTVNVTWIYDPYLKTNDPYGAEDDILLCAYFTDCEGEILHGYTRGFASRSEAWNFIQDMPDFVHPNILDADDDWFIQ